MMGAVFGSLACFHGKLGIKMVLPFLIICLVLLAPPSYGGEIADDDERFPVYEACQMKYGFFPPELEDPLPAKSKRKVPIHPQNQGLQECHQMYYRQKFCRNQYSEMKHTDYQRICLAFNKRYLKFFPMVFGMIACGAFLRTMQKVFKIHLPYSVLLMLIGMGLGALGNVSSICPHWTAFTMVARTPPRVILNVFLPVLIFESSFNMNSHLFFRSFVSIFLLALPGMVVMTFTTAMFCKVCFVSYEWTFWDSVLFGSIISATDPVAIVSILKEVGTSDTLAVLVDGESLLNDGVAILFYNIFSEIVDVEEYEAGHDDGLSAIETIWMCTRIIVGGPLFGWIVAKVTIRYLHLIFNDAAVEVSVTLCAAYLTYFISESYLDVSGVMALVFLGITLSSERTCISPEVQRLVSHFWEMLTYLANTVLFVLVGILVTETATNNFQPEDGYYLVFLYVALNIIRLVMIGLMSPVLSRIGYGLSWQNTVVMTWGGLRGAVGICLALQVYRNKSICQKENLGPKMLLLTAGIVLLTLFVNGTTTKKLLDMLKLTELSVGRMQDMANAFRQIRFVQHRSLISLRHGSFLADADWKTVEKFTNIVNPYKNKRVKTKSKEELKGKTPSLLVGIGDSNNTIQCPNCDASVENQPSPEELIEMTEDVRLRLLKALKVSCWHQYEQGILTEDAVHILTDLLEKTEDKKYLMIHASDFSKYWEVKGLIFWLRKKLLPYYKDTMADEEEYALPKQAWRWTFHKIASSYWFSLSIYLILIGNAIPVCWEAYWLGTGHHFSAEEYLNFYVINVCFTLIYLVEFIVRIIGIGCRQFMKGCGNVSDFVILVISLAEVIVSTAVLQQELEDAAKPAPSTLSEKAHETDMFLKFVRFLRLARIIRILRFFKPAVPCFMKFLNMRLNKKIFLSYDLAKGFVAAVDDVQKFLPQMIENEKIFLKFKESLELQRIEVIRHMGLLQKEHPGIAIAVKSRHASRAVLNHMKESLTEQKEDGLLDEKEYDNLMDELEQRMKQLWHSPAYMKPPIPELALANVQWMSVSQGGGRELYEFIYTQATLKNYLKGDMISGSGDPADGIYVIVTGLVKIHYEPSLAAVRDREEFGIIPNVEVFSDLTFEDESWDYFTTGTVIGEIGVLTGQSRGGNVTCETDVSLYYIPLEVMKQALRTFQDPFDSLEARMWRACGMRLVAALLPTEPSFSSWSMDKVKTYLELSAVPIGLKFKKLVVPDFVSDVVVIYGQVCNCNDSEEVYTAPCVISKNCVHIVPKRRTSVLSRVLLIGSQDADRFGEGEDDEDEDTSHWEMDRPSNTSWESGVDVELITEEEALSFMLHLQSRTLSVEVDGETRATVPSARTDSA